MANHKFKVGDLIQLDIKLERRTTAVFTIIRLVPGDREDLPPAYRVKTVGEGHERMVKEDEIVAN